MGAKKFKKKYTVCKHCAFLFLFKKAFSYPPLCLYKSFFIDSPIQKRTDLKGIKDALNVNKKNGCKNKRFFSFRALFLKFWLIRDCKKKGFIYEK